MTRVVVSAILRRVTTGSLLDRVALLIEEAMARGESQRQFSRRAGLSSTYIGTVLSRHRRGIQSDIDGKSVEKIAAAARVQHRWLITGEGPRELMHEGQVHEELESALSFAERIGIHELVQAEARERGTRIVLKMEFGEWFAMIEGIERDLGLPRRSLRPSPPNLAEVEAEADRMGELTRPRLPEREKERTTHRSGFPRSNVASVPRKVVRGSG